MSKAKRYRQQTIQSKERKNLRDNRLTNFRYFVASEKNRLHNFRYFVASEKNRLPNFRCFVAKNNVEEEDEFEFKSKFICRYLLGTSQIFLNLNVE